MTTRWKGNLINFSIELYSIYVLLWTEGKYMKKRQQGDDENKKEEMAMTTLKRRAGNDSIKYTRSNSEV
jgi:hypothetical protein